MLKSRNRVLKSVTSRGQLPLYLGIRVVKSTNKEKSHIMWYLRRPQLGDLNKESRPSSVVCQGILIQMGLSEQLIVICYSKCHILSIYVLTFCHLQSGTSRVDFMCCIQYALVVRNLRSPIVFGIWSGNVMIQDWGREYMYILRDTALYTTYF